MVIEFSPISLDILEDLLGADYEEYEEGLLGRRSKNFCELCRAQYKKRWGNFKPLCEGSVLDQLQDLEKRGMTKDEAMYTRATLDPVMWAGLTLNWYAEWYQAQFLQCSALAKVCRWGRRSGKSDALCVDMLHKALTRPGKKAYEAYTILVITPYEAQVDRLFGVLRNMIDRNDSVRESVLADIKNPQSVSFTNKSIIKGFTSGVKSGNKSEKIRGEDADCFVAGTAVNVSEFATRPIETLTLDHTVFGGGRAGFHIGEIEALVKRPEQPVLSLSTPLTCAHCTPEHPFFNGKKDVPAKDAEEVVVSLANRDLTFGRAVIRARLAGYSYGDGFIDGEGTKSAKRRRTPISGFAGQKEDLEQITEDLCILGDQKHKITTTYKANEEKGIRGWVSEFCSTHATHFLIGIAPRGKKVYQPLRVPDWVKGNFNYIKAAFLSGLFSAEATGVAYAANDKTVRVIEMNMRSTKEEWIDTWFDDVEKLLNDLDIKTSRPETKYFKEGDEDRWIGTLRVTNSRENIDRYVEAVGFCYSVNKTIQANCWRLYRWYERIYNLKTWKDNRIVLGETGIQSQISKRTGISVDMVKWNRRRFHPLFSTERKTVSELVEFFYWKDHYVILPIQKSIRRSVGTADVYNLQSGAQNRYMAAGMMSHNCIILDESDLLTKDDLEAIIAIQASHPACSINFSTTPTGKRETFHEVCTIKDLGFKEFWRVSHESPRYTEETDTRFRKMYTFGGYQREMLAMFGEEAEGVFQKKYVDAAIGTYELHTCVPNKDRMYLMGVDWNDHIHGTHIVINEYDPETEAFKIVAKDIVKGGEYTQLKSIDRIVELNQLWMPTYIGLDAGYGSTNEELLKIIGAKYPQTGLKEKMFAYNMSSKVIVKDAITGADLKKHIKPLMVEWSVQIMERGLQKFPASEDSKKGKGLVHQVRSYRKERVSPDGRPVYSQGYDHTLTAWNLTLLVFMLNETEFANSSRMVQFTRSGSPGKDGKDNNQGKEVPKKQLRLFGANRGGIVPASQTVRADLKSLRKALRPTKRSKF